MDETVAARFRALPTRVESVLSAANDRQLRARPAPGEWSAIEVAGHLVDKMQFWSERVERIAREDRPFLRSYDQDAYVRDRAYQSADKGTLVHDLQAGCEDFVKLIEGLPESALAREGVHEETGPISMAQCILLPIDSAEEHLNQMQAALTAAPAVDAATKS
jgi:hypothetical protein